MTHTRKPAPPIPEALIEWLAALYPNRCPRIEESDREVWFNAGSQKVVGRLIEEWKREFEYSHFSAESWLKVRRGTQLKIATTTGAPARKAGLPKLDGSLWHAYRRKWAIERKHHPARDVAEAGGWKDVNTLLEEYQQHADEGSLLAVTSETRKLRERGVA